MTERAPANAISDAGDPSLARTRPRRAARANQRGYVTLLAIVGLGLLTGCHSCPPVPADLSGPRQTVKTFQRAFDDEDLGGLYQVLSLTLKRKYGLRGIDIFAVALEQIRSQVPGIGAIASADIEKYERPTESTARVLVRASWLFWSEEIWFDLERVLIAQTLGGPSSEEPIVIADDYIKLREDLGKYLKYENEKLVISLPLENVPAELQDSRVRTLRIAESWLITDIRQEGQSITD